MVSSLVIASVLSIAAMSGEEPTYWINFPFQSESRTFVFPAYSSRAVFSNAMTAVDIQSVICDGQSLVPEILAPAEPPMMGVIASVDGQVVYQLTLGFLESWVSLHKVDSLFQMKKFRIPHSARMVKVSYRIRYPDGSTSKPLHVNFVASEERTHIVVLPTTTKQIP